MEDFKFPESFENVFASSYGTKRLSKSEIRSGLQDIKPALSRGNLMDQITFDVLCNVISRFESLELSLKQTSLDIIKRAGNNCTKQFGKLLCFGTEITKNDKQKYLKVLKQTVYILINLSNEVHQESNKKNILLTQKSRSKKVSSGINIETELQDIIQLIMSFLDLDISKLWEDRLVDDAFVKLLENFLYNLLEDQQLVKDKALKLLIFEALGCLIKKFGQNVNTEFKVVQMIQSYEHISASLAEALFIWTDKFQFLSLLPQVLRELDLICEDDLMKDAAIARSISNFITELGRLFPNQLLANIDLLLDRLEQEPYSIRNSVVDCIKEILLNNLCKEEADEKSKADRDHFIEILFEHANLDMNAFVRSRAVNSLAALVKAESFPIKKSHDLVDLGVKILLDKSGLVRKAGLQLLTGLLAWNPFGANLTVKSLEENLEKAEEKLKELQKDLPVKMETEEEEENEDEDPNVAEEEESAADCQIKKQKEIVAYFSMAYGFVQKIRDASHLLNQLLFSKTQSDVLESIQFFKVAFQFNLDFVIEGIDAMIHQIFSDDQKIRDAVVSAYTEMFFQNSSNSGRSMNPLMIVQNLTSITKRVTSASVNAFQCLLTELQKNQVIPSTATQIIWNKLSSSTNENVNEVKLILQLISILAHKNPEILRGKLDLLVKVGLRYVEQQNGYHDFQLAELTCTVLSKIAEPTNSSKKSPKYSHDHLVIKSVLDLAVKGFPLKSNNYIKFVNESITVLINLSESPFKIIEQLFNSIFNIVSSSEVDNELLTRLFSVSGTLALKAFAYVDCKVQADLDSKKSKSKSSKKRDKKSRRKSQNKSQVDQDDAEDDSEDETGQDHQDLINQIIENEIVGPKTLLGIISRLLVQACSETEVFDESSVRLQSAAALALSKYMTVSMKFCEKHLRLFFTLLEKSPHENIRANLVVCASDLCVRFPNLLEPWTTRIYNRLNDKSEIVKIYTLKALTNLILIDMIKVKGQVSEIARCIVANNTKLSSIAKNFFCDLSKKVWVLKTPRF